VKQTTSQVRGLNAKKISVRIAHIPTPYVFWDAWWEEFLYSPTVQKELCGTHFGSDVLLMCEGKAVKRLKSL